MAKIRHKKLQGASLVESIVAMLLVVLCFVIASTVFVRVNNSGRLVRHFMEKEWVNQIDLNRYSIEEISYYKEGRHLLCTTYPYDTGNQLYVFYYRIYNEDNALVYEEKRIKFIDAS